mgnify:CR=1 FL=1
MKWADAIFCAGLFAIVTACNSSVVDLNRPAPGSPQDPTAAYPLYFYYGPMKLMTAESFLYSLEAFSGHSFGAWDETVPEPNSQAFSDAGNFNGQFYNHCRLLGGCLEHRIPLGRTSYVGTAWVLELERAVVEATTDRAAFGMFPGGVAPDGLQAIDVIQHQYISLFGAHPSDEDLAASLAYFDGHLASPETTGMSPLESAGRGHCRALLGTNRFLFY